MNRKELETILKQHMFFDEYFDAYRCTDTYGNEVFISFQNEDCYICITDDPSNDCRGFSTDIRYDAVEVSDDQITFTDEDVTIALTENGRKRMEFMDLMKDYRVKSLSEFNEVDTYIVMHEVKGIPYDEWTRTELYAFTDGIRVCSYMDSKHPRIRDYAYTDVDIIRNFVDEHISDDKRYNKSMTVVNFGDTDQIKLYSYKKRSANF